MLKGYQLLPFRMTDSPIHTLRLLKSEAKQVELLEAKRAVEVVQSAQATANALNVPCDFTIKVDVVVKYDGSNISAFSRNSLFSLL
jgi:hypothetical protein